MTDFSQVLQRQRAFFASGATLTREFRLAKLEALERAILTRQPEIAAALRADFRKPELESFLSETAFTIEEIRFARKNLRKWVRPERVRTPLVLLPARSQIHREPYGASLIIGPWNYPFQLALSPLVAAIAAGNTVVLKPSELTPATTAVLQAILAEAFSPEHVAVVEGGVAETTALLAERFDHIFFTGSTEVGKIVALAAAKHLTPVTLELGGKSPVVVCADADLELAARRIAWGKFLNAGQTCVAPDYLYVHESVADRLLGKIRERIRDFYGSDPRASASYARIINARNFARLEAMLAGANVFTGGRRTAEDLYIEPTLLTDTGWDHPSMREEIFGPILPVFRFSDLAEPIREIRAREKPLSAYIFTKDPESRGRFLSELSFGGGCVNDTLVHLTNPHLPFGGVGASGTGAYHGEAGFLAFSHRKSVILRTGWLDFAFRYPPYDGAKLAWLRRFFRIPAAYVRR